MYEYHAWLVRVVDGDTVDLEVDLGFNVRIRERFRLAGIDTPEVHGVKRDSEEYKRGLAAARRVEEMFETVEGAVKIRTLKDRKGKFGRYLVEIFPWGDFGRSPWGGPGSMNKRLVEDGYATEYKG